MEAIFIKAEWLKDIQKMCVYLDTGKEHFEERFSKEEWANFILNLDTEFRIGGLRIDIHSTTEYINPDKIIEQMKDYLLKVNVAFLMTDDTIFL